MKVGIIGLGLIGGSLARDLRGAGYTVIGHDADEAFMQSATEDGVIERAGDLSAFAGCDIVVLATPVDAAPGLLHGLTQHARGVRAITDVGSTKRSIAGAATELGFDNFVGSHPLAGDHRSGWKAAVRGLFADARVFVCPTERSTSAAVSAVHELWRAVGARPEQMTADAHDELLGYISHLPQLISTTLGLALQDSDIRRRQLGPGGRDVTRLAGSDPAIWTAILRDNADHVRAALQSFEQQLAKLRTAVEQQDHTMVKSLFTAAQHWSSS